MDTLGLLLLAGIAFYLLSPETFAGILPESATDGGSIPSDGGIVSSGGPLSASDIAAYAQAAGFQGADLITATAIALAESGGNPMAHGDLALGQGSFGLWQIYSGAHPEFGPNFAALYDPATNAAAAYQIYNRAGMSFTPWTGTYLTGRYLQFVPTVQAALAAA